MKTYRYHQNRARTTTANMPFSRNIKSKYVNKRRVKTSHKPRRHMNKSATPSKRVGSRYTKSSKNRDNFAFDWFQPYDENEEFKNKCLMYLSTISIFRSMYLYFSLKKLKKS